MATKPTSDFNWADGVGAVVSEPGPAKRAQGYVFGEAPAAAEWNAVQLSVGEWIGYLEDVTDDHENRVAALEAGATLPVPSPATDAVLLRPYWALLASDGRPGEAQSLTAIAGADVVDIACDGVYVHVAVQDGGTWRVRRLVVSATTGGLTLDTDWAPSGSGTIAAIACSGGAVFVAVGSDIIGIGRSDDSVTVSESAGGTISRLRYDGITIYAVVGDVIVRGLAGGTDSPSLASLAAWWDHGAAIRDLALTSVPSATTTARTAVVLAGALGGGPAGDPYGDDYGVVGLSAGASPTVRLLHGTTVGGYRAVAHDGRGVYAALDSVGAIIRIPAVGLAASPVVATATWQSLAASPLSMSRLVCTGRGEVVGVSPGSDVVGAWCAESGATLWRYAPASTELTALDVDVWGLVLGADSAASHQVRRLTDGDGPRLIRRRAVNDTARTPYHQLLTPVRL